MTDISHPVRNDSFWPTEELAASKSRYSPQEASVEGPSDYPLTPTTPTGQTEGQTENALNCPNERKTEQLVRHFNVRFTRLYYRGDYSQALSLAQKAVKLAENCLADNSDEYNKSLNNLAICLNTFDQNEAALVYHTRAIELVNKNSSSIDLGMLYYNRAMTYEDLGDYDKARRDVNIALSLWEPTLEKDSQLLKDAQALKERVGIEDDSKADEVRRAEVLYEEIVTLGETQEYDEAITRADELIKYCETEGLVLRQVYLNALTILGELWTYQGETDKVQGYYLKALGLAEQLHGKSSTEVAAIHKKFSESQLAVPTEEPETSSDSILPIEETKDIAQPGPSDEYDKAKKLYQQKKYQEAYETIVPFIATLEKSDPRDDALYAKGLRLQGALLRSLKRYDEAHVVLQKALELSQAMHGHDHDDIADTLKEEATTYKHEKNFPRAEELLAEAIAMLERIHGHDHRSVGINIYLMGFFLQERGDYKGAEKWYLNALAIEERLGKGSYEIGFLLRELGENAVKQENFTLALDRYEQALLLLSQHRGPAHPDTIKLTEDLISVCIKTADFKSALSYLDGLLALKGQKPYDTNKELKFLSQIASGFKNKKEQAQAIFVYERLLQRQTSVYGENDDRVAVTCNKMGNYYKEIKEYARAEILYKKALEIGLARHGRDHKDVGTHLRNLGMVYEVQGRYDEALTKYEESLAVRTTVHGEQSREVALVYESLASLMEKKGDLEKAAAYYQLTIHILSQISDFSDKKIAELAFNLGHIYEDQEKNALSIGWYQKSLAASEQSYGLQSPAVAVVCNNLGVVYKRQKRYAEAIAHLERALQINVVAHGADSPVAAINTENLADTYSDTNQLEKARDLYLQALAIRKSKNPESDEVANTYNNLGLVYERLGNIPLVIQAYQKSLAIDEKNHGPLSERVAVTVSNLALLYYDQGQYEDALPLDERLIAIRRHLYGDEDTRVASALTSLGFTYKRMKEYESAVNSFDQAYTIYLKVHGQYHIKTVGCLSDRANIYVLSGNYQRAKELYDEFATAIRQVAGYHDSVDIAVALSDYVDLLSVLGDYPQARSYAEEALEMAGRLEGQESENYINMLESYYTILANMGDEDLAREMATKVIALQNNSPIPDNDILENAQHWIQLSNIESENLDSQRVAEIYGTVDPLAPDFQLTTNNLPLVYLRYAEDLERTGTPNPVFFDMIARLLETEADNLFTRPITHEKILTLQIIASIFSTYGMTKEAINQLKWLSQMTSFEFGPNHEMVADINRDISYYYHSDHKKNAARKYASLALKASQSERDRTLSTASEREAFALLAKKRGYLDHFLSLYHDKNDAVVAYNAVLDWKGFVAQTIASRREIIYENPEAQVVFEKLKSKRGEIAQIAHANGPPQEGADVHDRLVALTVEKEALERQLAMLSPQYAADQKVFRANHSQIADALPAGTILVDYFKFNHSLPADDKFVSKDHYLAFIIQGGKRRKVKILDLGPAEAIDKAIESFRERIASAKANTYWGRLIDQEANLVRSLVWDPVSAELGDAKTVLVAPDAAITGVSFAGLPSELPGSETQYLVEDYTFGYLENAKDLMRFRDNQGHLGQGALVVGAVNYDEPQLELAKMDNASTADTELAYRGGRAVACNQTDYRLYPGMEVEPLRVSELFQTAHVETMQLTGSDASEQNVYLHGMNRRYIHLATHGFFAASEGCGVVDNAPQYNPMVLSGVVLAGVNVKQDHPDGATDGILTAEEVSGLDLRGTELVVLAACETGLGEVKGGEGVMGLRRAFFLAGAQTLVMSLWNVEDESALQIMQDYYEQELSPDNKQSKLEVLRQAQLRLLQENRDKHDHGLPYTWAEFVSAGDWQ